MRRPWLTLTCAVVATVLVAATARAETNPITAQQVDGMAFGRIAAGPAGGSVTLSANGTRQASGNVFPVSGGTTRAAQFFVTGDPLTAFAIMLPASANLVSGTDTLTLDSFTSLPADSGTLGEGGTATVTVGATLHVAPGQPHGDYAGMFDVIISYN